MSNVTKVSIHRSPEKKLYISWFPEKNIKGLVYPKMKILSLITHHDTNEDLFDEI